VIWADRRLCDLLGIEHPIIQAPMSGSATPTLAAAVSNAGALGSLGCAEMSVEEFRAAFAEARALANGPINVNFFAHISPRADGGGLARARDFLKPIYAEAGLLEIPPWPQTIRAFDATILGPLLEAKPQIVSFHFGLPSPQAIRALKAQGAVILSTATTTAEARDLEARGADAVIAQGWEAGGHQGRYLSDQPAQIGTLVLVPQVVDAVQVPVIAAGGIADGRGIAAALALGASGVQMGTAFLWTDEAKVAPARREAMRRAGAGDTAMTKGFTGRPARAIVNRFVEAMAPHEDDLPPFPLLDGLTLPLDIAGATAGAPDYMGLLAGQSVARNRQGGAAELVETLAAETAAAIGGVAA